MPFSSIFPIILIIARIYSQRLRHKFIEILAIVLKSSVLWVCLRKKKQTYLRVRMSFAFHDLGRKLLKTSFQSRGRIFLHILYPLPTERWKKNELTQFSLDTLCLSKNTNPKIYSVQIFASCRRLSECLLFFHELIYPAVEQCPVINLATRVHSAAYQVLHCWKKKSQIIRWWISKNYIRDWEIVWSKKWNRQLDSIFMEIGYKFDKAVWFFMRWIAREKAQS